MVAKDARISRSMNNHTVLYHTTVAYTIKYVIYKNKILVIISFNILIVYNHVQ